ncbi:DNA-binding response regulator [Chitinophaga lutea]|uniref:DNA-binding response regulator n=1 Tax=Chitinophaga lutea TaxID=2488634 RepID=A0A3N4Q8P3_9BACT|nr:response regulator transcription factor [Chitinophaga lutea]RPE08084.1 DNA-binding response regulator [Chitinophaga lutea]
MTYSIVIVDDHLLIAKAIATIVEGFRDFEVLYEAENGQALTARFAQPRNIPDIVLLDITMPLMDGFETASWLKEHHPEVLVMALSVQDDEDALIRMIKHGARGYLHKNVHPTELEKALYTLVNKGMYFPDWATSKVFRTIAEPRDETRLTHKLSQREIEFLQFAATELTYKEIGEKMFCSPRTVESYRDSLFEKLGLKTRVGLVMYAVKNGLVKL